MKETTSKFIRVKCSGCKNEQNIYGKAATVVSCIVCGEKLAQPTGGKCIVTSPVLDVL